MSDQWYISREGQQHGPYTWEEIVFYARSGNIGEADLLWSETTGDWVRPEQVPGLLIAAAGGPAPAVAPGRKKKIARIAGGGLLAVLLVAVALALLLQNRPARIGGPGAGAVDTAAYLPGEPASLATTPESKRAASADGGALNLSLEDGTGASIPELPGPYEATLERLSSDLAVTATLQDMTGLVPTGAMRRLIVTGEGDPSGLKPVITIPASEAGAVNLETVNVLRVGDVLVNGELVRDYAMMLAVSLDGEGNLRFVDPLMPDAVVPAGESTASAGSGNPGLDRPGMPAVAPLFAQADTAAQPAALLVQTGVAQGEEREWMGSAYYLLMTFQDALNWWREPQLVRMVPDATAVDGGYRRPATAGERAELAQKPITNIVILVHGHNEEEKYGSWRTTESEPWLFSYKRLVWDLLYREITAEERQQPLYPYEGTAFYEFIYPTYRPIFSPVPDRTGEFGWRHETLGEALGRLVKEELERDPQLAAMMKEEMAFNVIVVAHSQGGLVARAGFHHMPEKFKERIVRFVSWGSPHHGAALYTLRYAFHAGHDLVLDGVRLPLQNIRNNFITGPLLVGKLNANVALDAPGIRDLRWDASKKDLLDIRAIFPSIKDDATEARITPSLYSANLAIFNETTTSETWGMKGVPYTLIYGITGKSAALEMVDVRGGWWFQYRAQQLLSFAHSTSIEQGAALNALVMKATYSPNDGAVPEYSQKAAGVSPFTVVNMGNVDHEEFYGAEPEQRGDGTIYLGVLTARKTFDEADLRHPTRAVPVIEAEMEESGNQAVITGSLIYPLYEPGYGGDGRLGRRIERVEARAGSREGPVIQGLSFSHADDGSFEGKGASSALPEGTIAVVAVFKDKSEVETEIGMEAEIYGQYTGTMQTTVINEEYLRNRGILPENDAHTAMLNDIYRNRNENFIHKVKYGGIETGVPLTFRFFKGYDPFVEGSTVVDLSIRQIILLPLRFANYKDGSEGDVAIIIDKNSFTLMAVEAGENQDWPATGAIYRVEGKLSGNKLTGTWSVEENGNVMFQGVFEAKKIN